jgi:hypothetical protein
MPFVNDDPARPWNYRNCAVNKETCPNYEYQLPPDFVNSKERFIVIRQVRAMFELTTMPQAFMLNDACLMSDLCCECDLPNPDIDKAFNATRHSLGYICICNDPNMKKKRWRYVWRDQVIHFGFMTIYGLPIIPSHWLVDMLLVYR